MSDADASTTQVGLRQLLLGSPLQGSGTRDNEWLLDVHVRKVAALVAAVYGASVEGRDAAQGIARVARLGQDAAATTCKRAVLLLAIHYEPIVREHFERCDAGRHEGYTHDLATRVLPYVAPRFVQGLCQHPDVFVTTCLLLLEMWTDACIGTRGANA